MAAEFERRGIDFFLEELIAVLELEADATPAIVFEPRRIYATVEERLKDRRVVSTEDNAAREYAYSLVTRLYYLANWNEDEKVGTPA